MDKNFTKKQAIKKAVNLISSSGAFGAKIRIEFELSAALIYKAGFLEKGIPVDFSVGNDPYQSLFSTIQNWFNTNLMDTTCLNEYHLRNSIDPS